MGNEWELQDSKVTKIKDCPCRNGAYVKIKKEYKDDFFRDHTDYESYCNCMDCNKTFDYYNGYWLKKEDFKTAREISGDIWKYKENIYRKLYGEYINSVLNHFSSKKALYEFLFNNRLFNVPGTLQTFYKNGIGYYVSEKSVYNLEQLLKLITLTVGDLQHEDTEILKEINEKEIEHSNFVKTRAVEEV